MGHRFSADGPGSPHLSAPPFVGGRRACEQFVNPSGLREPRGSATTRSPTPGVLRQPGNRFSFPLAGFGLPRSRCQARVTLLSFRQVLNVAVISHKGGSGKSALAANLAGTFAANGATVLAVDVDPQGGLTAALGIEATKPTLYEVLNDQARPEEAVRETTVRGLSLLPADIDLAGAELEMPQRGRWHDVLRRAIGRFAVRHAVTLLDTPPGLGVLSFATLRAADAAIVACPPEFMAYRALTHVLRTSARAGIPVIGIVPTMAHRTTRHAIEVLDELQRTYPQLILPAIPRRIVVQEAAMAGLPLAIYAPRSDAGFAFAQLAKEVTRRADQTSDPQRPAQAHG